MESVQTEKEAQAVFPSPAWVEQATRDLARVWWESDSKAADWGPTYSASEQRAREAELARFLETLSTDLRSIPRTAGERQSTQERILQAFARFARAALDLQERHIELLLRRGFPEVGIAFAQRARRFDATIRGADIFQASRNLWTSDGLQLLLGLPISLSPAMFAYSMLYPYSDNYLDNPKIAEDSKRSFNARFARRLSGEALAPDNEQERLIYRLVGMIEGQFDRAAAPQVYESLRAIHQAQDKSVRLLRRNAPPYDADVLGISLEKGGASVLADGYLVAGALSQPEAAVLFGYGAFLQFADDLQDVRQDARDGVATVFSQVARRWRVSQRDALDPLIERSCRFGQQVMAGLSCFTAPDAEPLKELMWQSAQLLLISAAGQAGNLCSRGYLRDRERHSPFRFGFLAQVRRRIARERLPLASMIEAFATLEA